MRVLIVHNRYRSATPSGENIVVDREVELLAGRGHDVETFFRSNDDYSDLGFAQKIRASTAPVFGASARKDFQKTTEDVPTRCRPRPQRVSRSSHR